MSGDRRYPQYQYSPRMSSIQDPAARFGHSPKPAAAPYPRDHENARYQRLEEELHPAYARPHPYSPPSRSHMEASYRQDKPSYVDDYHMSSHPRSHYPNGDDRRRAAYPSEYRDERDEYYSRAPPPDRYPVAGPSYASYGHESWDRERGIQPSYQRAEHSPVRSIRMQDKNPEARGLRSGERAHSPPRPTMSIFNMLNDRTANGAPHAYPERSRAEYETLPLSDRYPDSRSGRSTYDPARDFGSNLVPHPNPAHDQQHPSSRYRDYSPDDDLPLSSASQPTVHSMTSIANLLDHGPLSQQPSPIKSELRVHERLEPSDDLQSEAARTLESLSSHREPEPRQYANGEPLSSPVTQRPSETPAAANATPHAATASTKQGAAGKVGFKLRNNPLPPSKDIPNFYAPPPPTKKSRDADGWDSDLSTEENRPLWSEELSTYILGMDERMRMIENAFQDNLQEKQIQVERRLARAYEGRHFALMRRVRLREHQEAVQQELKRREKEESARNIRDREIEMELLDTLSDTQAGGKSKKGSAGNKARASRAGNEAERETEEEGDELEDQDISVAEQQSAAQSSKATSKTNAAKPKKSKGKGASAAQAEGKNKKRKLDGGPTESSPMPASEVEAAAADATFAMDADVSTFTRLQEGQESALQSRQPSPSFEDGAGFGSLALDPSGKVPIDARRTQQLEDAHKKIWTSIAKRDIPKVYRTVISSASSKAMYWRRLSSVVQREAKRGAARNNKTVKDVQMRARKVMREVLVFWKRNEKEERELRKKAEKEALEKAKKEEEMREAKRQARKLNFLISQTELYSHFVGSKLKTDEAEESSETAAGSKSMSEALAVDPHAELAKAEAKLAGLDEIDFDDDDETNLRAHAARNAQEAVRRAKEKATAFDATAAEERRRNEAAEREKNGEATSDGNRQIAEKDLGKAFDSDDMNFLNPTSMGQMEVKQPKMLTCQLKEYQLKGLNWLANLYEQGINGILADEMGLGKTVQSISLMAYLAEVHDIWGPFLVIAPASTLHNWQQEISRFVPTLKALPYWGNVKDRAILRKFWNRKQISYNRDAPFHVLVTSYQLVVSDEKYFQRVKWQYMILDEAQAIKSSSSIRWKILLGFHCRNRLLLTGTPVQNSMQELWALLHFIMPSLFDSHDEFSEWFSKDIESHAENKGTLNEHQLRRLHMILKPFMLRRIKKNVQNELGEKIEIDVFCEMSARQKALYKGLRSRLSVAELMDRASSNDEAGLKSLMNLVMQFRKVCNHPELFERADVQAPFAFASFAHSGSLAREGDFLHLPDSTNSLIELQIPKLIVREGGILEILNERSRKGFDTAYLDNLLNIWRSPYIHKSLEMSNSAFAFLPLLGLNASDAEKTFHGSETSRILSGAAEERRWRLVERYACDDDFAASSMRPRGKLLRPVPSNSSQSPSILLPLDQIAADYCHHSHLAKDAARAFLAPVVAPPIRLYCDDRPFMESQQRMKRDPKLSTLFFGLSPEARESEACVEALQTELPDVPLQGLLPNSSLDQVPHNGMKVPQMNKLIVDSSKLAKLDVLLRELKAGGHRVLIYFQMTRMIDLMEEYLIYRQYKYLRLDGASKISDRRDMVTDWQTKPELFIFLLSTRAGGLGINLTAADTVVFYDHDWNPSNDSQAMDRAHRLGQTRQVTVYRLITQGTIDERIVRLARNKKEVQDIVVGNKAYSETGMARPQEIVSLLLDDDELAESMLRRKQAEEAQSAQEKADYARAMHAKRRLNKDKAAAVQPPVPSGLDWALEDDEDDFFGARPPAKPEPETIENTPQLEAKKKPLKKARIGEAAERMTPLELDSAGGDTTEASKPPTRKSKSHRKKTMDELAGVGGLD